MIARRNDKPKKDKPEKPGEVPVPGRNPEVIPEKEPTPGVWPHREPEIQPEREPLTMPPSAPPEVPPPPVNQSPYSRITAPLLE